MMNPNSKPDTPFDPSGRDMDDLLSHLSFPMRSHSRRVAITSSIIAECTDKFLGHSSTHSGLRLPVIVFLGGSCHDIGKLLLPTFGMSKIEYLKHPLVGVELLAGQKQNLFDNDVQMQHATDMVRYHHERADGKGFPDGLKAKDIPLTAGICSVADWLDHHMCANQESFEGSKSILKIIDEKIGSHFIEIAALSAKLAWPRLEELYAEWAWDSVKTSSVKQMSSCTI